MNYAKQLSAAASAAKEAGRLLRRNFSRKQKRHAKGANDFATEMDFKAQALIKRLLEKKFASYGFVGEESLLQSAGNEFVWLIDPLDGTVNYALGLPWYCVSIALAKNGEPVAGAVCAPSTGELFTAARGSGAFLNGRRIRASGKRLEELVIGFSVSHRPEHTRRVAKHLPFLAPLFLRMRSLCSISDEACKVACGQFGAYYNIASTPWDFAAAKVIVEEAGGVCSDVHGRSWKLSSQNILVANNRRTQKLIVEAIAKSRGKRNE